MRKVLSVLSISLLIIVMALTMVACKQPEAEKVTLTLYDSDGATVLSSQQVVKGEKPTKPADPVKEGYRFLGWFVTPTSKLAFNFDTALNEDANAYAQWVDTSFVDDRDWVISGTMNGWGSDLSAAYHMTKTGNNTFVLTINLEVDDEFQLTVLLDDGTLSYSNEGARAADKHLVGGEEYLVGKGGFGTYHNLCVLKDGNYTLTLSSSAETDGNVLTVVRNGDIVPDETKEIVNYYIKGAGITDWKNAYVDSARFIVTANGLTLTVGLKANETFMFYGVKTVDDQLVESGEYFNASHIDDESVALFTAQKVGDDGKLNGNIITKEAGIYTFILDVENKVISATMTAEDTTEYAYYLDGSVMGGTWGDYQKSENTAKHKLIKNGDVYSLEGVELKAGEELSIRMHKADEEVLDFNNVVASFNAGYLFGSVGFGAASKTNLNVKVAEDGVYTVSFNAYTKILTIGKAGKDVYVKGTMNGWAHEFSADYMMVPVEDNADEYQITLDFAEGCEFGLAIYNVGEKEGNGGWAGKDALGVDGDANEVFATGNNLTCSEAGTYRVTYNYRTGKINIYKVQ